MSWLNSIWKFSRPHTIIGTSLSVISLYVLALIFTNTPLSYSNLIIMAATWITCLLGNLYIVGLNQLIDLEIDKINKPHLPLASGEISQKQGQIIVIIVGLLSVILGLIFGFWLAVTVIVSLIIGTAYSLPPVRLKRFPFLASFCILTVRGLIVNLGLFCHYTQQFTGQFFLNLPIYILSIFILLFSIAIAILKDVPDQEGDQKYQITTFTILVGKKTVFNIGLWLISLCYLGIILSSYFLRSRANIIVLIIIHLILLMWLWIRAKEVNLEEKREISDFYQFIWKLFFWEYLLFPTVFLF